jgi:hypothetical protein
LSPRAAATATGSSATSSHAGLTPHALAIEGLPTEHALTRCRPRPNFVA